MKLSAIAESDPIAALGMIQLAGNDPAALQKAVANARKLLEKYPSRLTGSFIMAELGKRGVKVTPGPNAATLENVLAQFPKDWMRILDQPQLFYAVRIEPVAGRVSVPIGEPVLVQVTIYNTSNFALTLGAEGVVHPDLWFDAQTRGVQPQFFPAEAFARMGGPMVLAPKSGVASQVVRLDQAQLLGILERNPAAHFQITASVMTNPTQVGGQVRPGPAGTQVQLSKLMERRGAPVGHLEVRQKLGETIGSGSPEEKIRAAETLTKFATLFTGPGAGEEAKAFGAQAAEAVRLTSNDADPTVRAWASYLYAVYTRDQGLLTRMLQDPSWVARTLGIVATDYTAKDNQLYEQMARSDDELLVRNLAAAAAEAKIAQNRAAATQPGTTQPGAATPASSLTTPAPTQPTQPPAAPSSPARIDPVAPALTPAVPGSGANGAPPAAPVAPSAAPVAPSAAPVAPSAASVAPSAAPAARRTPTPPTNAPPTNAPPTSAPPVTQPAGR